MAMGKHIKGEWVQWLEAAHIRDGLVTGHCREYAIQEIRDTQPQACSLTFNRQYLCENMAAYQAYQKREAPALQRAHSKRYKDQFVAFRTLLRRL